VRFKTRPSPLGHSQKIRPGLWHVLIFNFNFLKPISWRAWGWHSRRHPNHRLSYVEASTGVVTVVKLVVSCAKAGDLDADFGYTGFFIERAVNLDLTWYRAYDSDKGRWLSRDPLAESVGLNLFAYVLNSPM
jgi:RHS repeat-associated protein